MCGSSSANEVSCFEETHANGTCLGVVVCVVFFFFRPEIRRDYPLNLSILISGGKETNQDSLSNGE